MGHAASAAPCFQASGPRGERSFPISQNPLRAARLPRQGSGAVDGRSYPGATGVALFYVDGDLGDDLSNGLAAHPSAAGGPKRTFGAGLDVAGASGAPAATVVIRESTNAYLEGVMGAGSNTVTVRPIGEVLVRP